MSIGVRCPKCTWSGRAKDELAGRSVKCPRCATPFRVGAESEAPKAAGSSQAARPLKPPPLPAGPLAPAEAVALVTGDIRSVGTTLGYRFSLALVGLMMILLPLIYLAMIAGVGFGVWWHLVHNVGMLTNHNLRGKAASIPILAYVGPAIIGVVLVLFMVKPLLARRQQESEPCSLRPEDEPTLFAFVNRICQAVGAPMPKRIDIDLQVNASASYRRGLASLARNDLVLTIGMPLVAGLSVEQFAGVLAHEFGHFTQSAGMGFGALIHRINGWFARVVWQRDAWDVRLEAWEKGSGLWIGMIFCLARWCVWLTRRILFGLMWCAHALSCHLSRQMEYDADLHQTRLVGGQVVADTFERLPRLAVAEEKAWRTLQDSLVEGTLADSVPDLVVTLSKGLSAAEEEAIRKSVSEEKTALFATHPTNQDRIRRAKADGATPRLACQQPATRLFRAFPSLCRSLTLAVYEQLSPEKLATTKLRPAAEVISRQKAEEVCANAATRWLESETSPFLPFPGAAGPLEAPAGECLTVLRETLTKLRLTPAHPREHWDEMFAPLSRHLHSFLVETIVGAKQIYDDKERGVSLKTLADVEQFRDRAWNDFSSDSRPLAERRDLVDRRIRAALGWLASPEAAALMPDADRRRSKAARLSRALTAVSARQPDWTRLAGRFGALEVWFGHASAKELDPDSAKALSDLVSRIAAELNSLREALIDEPYPLGHADPAMTIGRYLVPEPVPTGDPTTVASAAGTVRNLYPWLAWQLVGRLILHAEAVEAVLLREEPAG